MRKWIFWLLLAGVAGGLGMVRAYSPTNKTSVPDTEVKSKYTEPTPANLQEMFERQSTQLILQALSSAEFAGRIQQAAECPCMDVVQIENEYGSTVRISNDRCKNKEEVK